MGCGASNNVVPAQETANGHDKTGNGVGNGHDHNDHNSHHDDNLPTVVLPETPVQPKPRKLNNFAFDYTTKNWL